GPAIAGIVAEKLHWRLIFFGLLPVLVVSGSLAYRGLRQLAHEPATERTGGVSGSRIRDGLVVGFGVALLTAGLASDNVAIEAVAGIGGLAITLWAFVRLVPPGTLRAERGYPTAVLLRGLLTFAFFAIDAYVALLLVEVRGWSAAAAGIALTAATVSWTA